jgi:hypothetical protein
MHKHAKNARDVPPVELWRSVLWALENERCLDLRYRANSTSLRDDEPVPNYKVMKQLALRNRLGLFYRPFIGVALIMIPVVAVADWVCAVVTSLLPTGVRLANLHIVATTPVNVELIEGALATESGFPALRVDHDLLSRRRLSSELGLRKVLFCVVCHVWLLLQILGHGAERRTDLILHSRDAMVLLMLACYARSTPDHAFATEDHYQRWVYLLSHHSRHLSVVQHGALDAGIPFAHPFGAINTLYLREQGGRLDFEKYYKVRESKLFLPARKFKRNKFTDSAVFIASSFPHVDSEIELARLIKGVSHVPLIVKFHPAHHYDQRRLVLAALADYICADDEHPACRVFVSHNSFMENDYRACGIPAFSMERLGGPAASAQAISDHLASAGRVST